MPLGQADDGIRAKCRSCRSHRAHPQRVAFGKPGLVAGFRHETPSPSNLRRNCEASAACRPARWLRFFSVMSESHRRAYLLLWLMALAFGWMEAAVVVYLREIYLREANYVADRLFPLVSLPARLTGVEVVREACTLVVLAVVAWLTNRRWAVRTGAFLLLFGIWDLTYYGVLRFVLGWPESLMTWDILFLIPLPWVAPVWAPATVASVFMVCGSYLFWTPSRPRQYRWTDVALLLGSALIVVVAFLGEWKVVVNQQVPQSFPAGLFWAGVLLGTLWFVRVERREVHGSNAAPSRAETAVPGLPRGTKADAMISEYAASRGRLDGLLEQAAKLGGRLQRLGQELSEHPDECAVVQSLPTTGTLIALTDDIRDTARRVEDLRERLILLGRSDVIEQPDGFFH